MRNILVIGGSYFAGRVFVEEMVRRGDAAIYVFNRGRRPLAIDGVTELVGDRDRPDQIGTAIPPLDWSAVVDFCAYDPAQVTSLLTHLTGRVQHYVFISTTTVYQKTARLPVTEDAPKLTGPQVELGAYADYGFDKWRAEQAAQAECDRLGIAMTIFRPSIIYGCYNYAPRETFFFDRLTSRRPIELPENGMALYSFVWVVDMARMLVRALEEPQTRGRIYNLASPELISYQRIVDVLGEITGKQIETLTMPIAEIERREIPLPFPLADHLVYSGQAVTEDLRLAYTPFVSGLRETLRYYLMVQRAGRAAAGG